MIISFRSYTAIFIYLLHKSHFVIIPPIFAYNFGRSCSIYPMHPQPCFPKYNLHNNHSWLSSSHINFTKVKIHYKNTFYFFYPFLLLIWCVLPPFLSIEIVLKIELDTTLPQGSSWIPRYLRKTWIWLPSFSRIKASFTVLLAHTYLLKLWSSI